jgi:phage pi2 protein 07
LVIIAILVFRRPQSSNETIIEQQTAMIQEQLQHVGKLIVTEATFSQIYTYEDTKKYFFDLYASKKKAIVTATARVTVSFDLRQLQTELDEENKRVIIKYIPEEEVMVYPKLDYYDMQSETFNTFDVNDLKKIQKNVEALIEKEIYKSGIRKNAKDQLIGELTQIFILTKAYGWTLEYEHKEVENFDFLQKIENNKPKLFFNFN